jgi:hypothetical protein
MRTPADINAELKELKSLVRKFLKAVQHVPLRAIDCNQDLVNDLECKLLDATRSRPSRSRRVSKVS